MDQHDFSALGRRIYGVGWQGKLARRLGMNSNTMSKYATGKMDIPPTVALALSALATEAQIQQTTSVAT
jgi:DNA-binding transcriptional regulator YdaS (Cro superfamily)